jgi:hypothetical protein
VREFVVVFCEDDDRERLMSEEKSRFSGIGAPHFDASCARPHFQLLELLSTKEI